MKWKTITTLAVAGVMTVVLGAHDARALLIDHFADTDVLTTSVTGTFEKDNAVASPILGGTRNIEIDLTTSCPSILDCLQVAVDGGGVDQLFFALSPSEQGTLKVTWGVSTGGAGDALVANDAIAPGIGGVSDGTGGVDLTDGGTSDVLRVQFSFSDLGGNLQFILTDGSGFIATGDMALPVGLVAGTLDVFLSLDCVDFSCSNPGFDFTDILNIMMFNNTGVAGRDWEIHFVDTTRIPEPATLALFGMGLLGFGLLSRRRRRRSGLVG